ncbi:hypothetical protein QAD02_020876 [Eretmocerus hayati]|uniref:Uncharacterized protein n=1 Tax=Eretmocerus hayati TaxID=131215 RepID=A0ACC2PPN2_9HYME|nr:hypothetical protein QAD02_020876 [Eretmocerus hayati]
MTENSDGQKTIQDLQSVSLHLEKSVKDGGQQSSLQSGSYDTVASDFAEEYRTKSARDHPTVKSTSVEYPKSTADYTLSTHSESQMKQDAVESDNILRDSFEENHGSPSRLSHGSMNSAPISMANKFLPGQSTQTAGPTPTLNQLLQASTPVHRFHSAYSSAAADTFQQWPTQRSPVQPVFPQSSQKLTVQVSFNFVHNESILVA